MMGEGWRVKDEMWRVEFDGWKVNDGSEWRKVIDFGQCFHLTSWLVILYMNTNAVIHVTVHDLVPMFSFSWSWLNSDQFSFLNFQNPLNGSKLEDMGQKEVTYQKSAS